MFQGNELPRMLLLLVIAVGGWASLGYYMMKGPAAPGEAGPVVNGKPPAVETDRSDEFETVTDKTAVTFRDMAAYSKLLAQVRELRPDELAARSRRDVFFAHLWDQPKEFRGVPVRLSGTARRVLYYKSKLSRTGWLYETWMFTPDSQGHPYVCVSEEAPKGFPVGANLSERVSFDGYFLKLMRYDAGDVPRAAPLLVGRVVWTPEAAPVSSNRSLYWMLGGVAVMFMISLYRWVRQLRRSLAPKPRPSFLRDRPNEEIEPDALSDFFRNVPDDDGIDSKG
jgi:hypothetical protein